MLRRRTSRVPGRTCRYGTSTDVEREDESNRRPNACQWAICGSASRTRRSAAAHRRGNGTTRPHLCGIVWGLGPEMATCAAWLALACPALPVGPSTALRSTAVPTTPARRTPPPDSSASHTDTLASIRCRCAFAGRQCLPRRSHPTKYAVWRGHRRTNGPINVPGDSAKLGSAEEQPAAG